MNYRDDADGNLVWPSRVGLQNGRGSDSSGTERGYRSTSRSEQSAAPTRRGINGHHDMGPPGSIGSPEPIPSLPYWSAKRHLTCGNPAPPPPWAANMRPWRASPAKLKTHNAALVLCLNIDVDPPDVVKTNPCATLECWVDPHTMPSFKALEIIGTNLRHQFEGLSPKILYKAFLDPSDAELREGCIKARTSAKDDAVLFYYNGHGVPKPTPSGELWCFNKNYTQYIPVSLQEIQRCLGTPCVYIWDCSSAGHLLNNFITFAKRLDDEIQLNTGSLPDPLYVDSIQLAACLADETLPTCPELPADLFTSCLTSPIDIALRHFIMNNQLPSNITADMVMQLPGDLKDRRTPLGELNWIFTAITDTIAWTTFSNDVFTRLYRSDLLVASLFRNFLLAERIMKNYHCTPHTSPPLPATNTHPLWASWDHAVDACLRQLPTLLKNTEPVTAGSIPASLTTGRRRNPAGSNPPNDPTNEQKNLYVPSRFFADQLTAFEVWISRGGSALTKRGPLSLPLTHAQAPSPETVTNGSANHTSTDSSDPSKALVPRKPPDQLPIVLQVLLSQPHRLRALILLSQFVDLGPWAVHLALTIGIFPYISRLLQAAGQDLRPVLIFIWARILAVDPTCQVDLYNSQGYRYFANVLAIPDDPRQAAIPNSSEHKAMCAFILSAIARDYPPGQRACWSEHVFDACYERLDESDFLLRQWSALCIAQIWDAHDDLRIWGVDKGTQDKLIILLSDDSAEVRGAALYALGTFMGASGSVDKNKLGGGGSGNMNQLDELHHFRMEIAVVTGAALAIKEDASPMVRKELVVLISCLVKEWRGYFIVCAWIYWEEERRRLDPKAQQFEEDVTAQAVAEWLGGFDDPQYREEIRVVLSSFFTMFIFLLELSCDPYQEVATNAQTVVDYIIALLLESPFTRLDNTSLNKPPPNSMGSTIKRHDRARVPSGGSYSALDKAPVSPVTARPGLNRSDSMTSSMSSTITSGVTSTLRRTSSFANALRNLAGGIAFPTLEDGRASPRPQVQDNSHLQIPGVSRPPSPNLNYAQYTSPYSRPSTPPNDHLSVQAPPSPGPSNGVPQHTVEYLPSDVMEALMEEDMERLRARRRVGAKHRHHGQHGMGAAMSSPSGSTFSVDSGSSVILGLGTGVGIRDVLPLKSRFYDWCCEYFKEPQMRQPEPDEPGSTEYNYQVWRQQRNEDIINNTRAQADVAENCRWDRPVATLQASVFPAQLAFHAFDPHLAVTNEADLIIIYDWMHRRKLSQFFNGNPKGSSITSLHFINEEVGGIVLTGAGDGVVRLYRNYDPDLSGAPVQMVSSFRGLSEVVRLNRGAGMVLDWKQNGGILLASGDSRIVRVWDAHIEAQVTDIDTTVESPTTSMSSEEGSSTAFLASFGDGSVRLFDPRLDEDAVVRSYNAHTSWVQGVKWHPTVPSQFVTASADGEVKLFDVRGGSDRPLQAWDVHPQGLSAFDVHQLTGVFAATSTVTASNWRTQRAAVHSLTTSNALSTLSSVLTVPPPRDPLSPYIQRSSSLVFHPREMIYAVGSLDGSVRVLGCKFPS